MQGTFPRDSLVSSTHFLCEGPQQPPMPGMLLPGCSPGHRSWCCVGVVSSDVGLQEQPPSAKFALKSCVPCS